MEESDQSPQLKGVVIISLPPPDNPSLGKTITAFTLTGDEAYPQLQDNSQLGYPLPVQRRETLPPLSNPRAQFSMSRSFFLGSQGRRRLFGFLGISLFALLIYTSLVPSSFEERRANEDGDEEANSFLFPVYYKNGTRETRLDVEHSLRRFVFKENVVAITGDIVVDDRVIARQGTQKLGSSDVVGVGSSTLLPVRGNIFPDGFYYTYVLLGNPPRPYYLDVDTGSDLTWIQCDAPCTSCAKGANFLYKPRRGSILPPKDSLCAEVQRRHTEDQVHCESCSQCDYEIEYADKSSSMGVLAQDELHMMVSNGSLTKSNIIFGCAYDQQGLLLTTLAKTDGVLGLSRGKVSLPAQLASRGVIKNTVGHCLTRDVEEGVGYLFLGDDFVPRWGMSWVPMIDSSPEDYYYAQIATLKYGNALLSLGGKDGRSGQIAFDTGSSYTYFTKEAYSELVDSLKDVSKAGLSIDASDSTLPFCWRASFPIRSVIDVKRFFKTLTLQFESKWRIVSTKFRIPPEGYLIISKKGNACLGILDGSNVHDGSTFILGDISLRGQLIVYDNENKKIGWMPSSCAKPNSFQSLSFGEG